MKSATEEWTNCERLNLLKAALEHESWDNRCTELTSKCGSDRPGNFFNAKRCKQELDRICAEALPGHIATGRDDVHYTKRFVLERWIEFYKGEVRKDTDRMLEMKNIEMRKNMDLVERLLSRDKRPPPDQIRHLLEIAREKDKNHPNPEKLERMRLAYQKRIAEVLREQERTGESSVSSGPPVSIPPTRASTVQLPKAFKSPSPLKSPIRSVDEVIAEAEAAMNHGDVQEVVLFDAPAPSQESEMKMDTEEAPEALPPPPSEPSAVEEEEQKMELEEVPAAEPIAEAEQEKEVEEELARPETLPVTSPSSSKKGRSPGPSITAAVASPTTPSRRHLRGTVAPQVDSAEIEKKAADIIAAGKAKERAKEQAVVEHVKEETTTATTTTAAEEVVVEAAVTTPATQATQQRRGKGEGRQQQQSQQRRSTRGKAGETITVVSPPSALPVKTEAATESTTTTPVYTRKKGANERRISTSSSVSAATANEKQTVEGGAQALEAVPKEEKIEPAETPISRRHGGKMRAAAEKSEETAKKAERAGGGNRKRKRQEMEEETVVIEDDDAPLRPPTPKVKAQMIPAETPSSGRRVTRRSQGAAAVDKAFEHSATASVASDTSTTAADSAAFATPTSTVPLRHRRKTSSDAASEGRRTPSMELDITPTTSMAAPSRKRMRVGGRGEPMTTTISPLGPAIPVATPPVAEATPTLPASTTPPLSALAAPVAQESIALCDVETETEIVIKTAEKEKQTTEKSPRRGSNRIEKEAPSTAIKPATAAHVRRYRSSDRDAPATRDAGIQTNKKVDFAPSDEVHITFDANEAIFHPIYDLENEKKSRVKALPSRDDDEKTRRRGTAKQSESEAEEDTVVSPARASRNEGKHEITVVINADKDTIDYWVAASGQQQSAAAAGSSTPAAAAAAASPSSQAAMTPPTGKKGSRKGAAEEGGASRRKSMQAIKGEDMAMKNSLLSVMRDVFSHRHSSVFSYPVNDRDAPGYSAAVKNPVHLWKIRQDIDNGIIRSGITTRHRIVHMFMNAVMFNSSGHDVNTFAHEMYRETMLVKEPEVRRTKSTFMSAPRKPFVDEASLSFSRPPSEVPEKELKREVESDGETQRERETRPVRKVFKRKGVNNTKKRAAT